MLAAETLLDGEVAWELSAGCGTKEMLVRALDSINSVECDPFPFVSGRSRQCAGQVATSAEKPLDGFLGATYDP